MDATTGIVILIFVFSIFSGVTGQKEKAAKQSYLPHGELVSAPNFQKTPLPKYTDGYSEDLNIRIVNFIKSYAKNVNLWDANLIAESIAKYSSQYDVNPRLLCALIARESRFNRFAISPTGAQGLGQLLPSTASTLKISDPFDIEQNVMGTTRYLKNCLEKFNGNQYQVAFAIAGYLEGPNAVKRNNAYKSSSGQYIGDIFSICNKI